MQLQIHHMTERAHVPRRPCSGIWGELLATFPSEILFHKIQSEVMDPSKTLDPVSRLVVGAVFLSYQYSSLNWKGGSRGGRCCGPACHRLGHLWTRGGAAREHQQEEAGGHPGQGELKIQILKNILVKAAEEESNEEEGGEIKQLHCETAYIQKVKEKSIQKVFLWTPFIPWKMDWLCIGGGGGLKGDND